MSLPNKLASIEANRRRYEALRAAGQGAAPKALPAPTDPEAVPLSEDAIIHREHVPGGWYWTTAMRRGEALRLVNREGTSTVSLIAWRTDDPSERINASDTLKVQWSASLRKGRVILSDMGRVVFSVIEDSCGAHDALVGGSTASSNAAAFGEGARRNTRDNFVAAVGKLGLARRDIPPCIAFFAPVTVGPDGDFVWDEARRRAGDLVDLRAEMDLLVAVSNCPHPLDPASVYTPGGIDLLHFRAPPALADDPCRSAGPEANRAFAASDRLAREAAL